MNVELTAKRGSHSGLPKSCRGLQHSKTLREERGPYEARQPSAALVPPSVAGIPLRGCRKACYLAGGTGVLGRRAILPPTKRRLD
jgi:hypothetical protein